jgi:hypothetical protein
MAGPISQMYEHALNPVSGFDPLYAMYKYARLSDDVLNAVDTVPAGRVAYLDNAGEFQLSDGDPTSDMPRTAMPLYLWQGSHDYDVRNDGTSPSTGRIHWYGVNPNGVMSGLVAAGGYELQTTEFDADQDYLPNQLLTCDLDDDSIGGRITNQSQFAPGNNVIPYSDWVCGVASWHVNADYQTFPAATVAIPDPTANVNLAGGGTSPVGVNAHQVSVLTFWTYFLPGSDAA